MSNLDIEFFAKRAMLASKDRDDSADWQPLMEDIMATGQGIGTGIGVLARLAGHLPGSTLEMMLVNSLPVLSKWTREQHLFSRISCPSSTSRVCKASLPRASTAAPLSLLSLAIVHPRTKGARRHADQSAEAAIEGGEI